MGRPVNKVYTEFLASARKHKQVENLERVFNSFIDRCDKYRRWGVKPSDCFYVTKGTLCPIRVPALTFINTHPNFFWLTKKLLCLVWGT